MALTLTPEYLEGLPEEYNEIAPGYTKMLEPGQERLLRLIADDRAQDKVYDADSSQSWAYRWQRLEAEKQQQYYKMVKDITALRDTLADIPPAEICTEQEHSRLVYIHARFFVDLKNWLMAFSKGGMPKITTAILNASENPEVQAMIENIQKIKAYLLKAKESNDAEEAKQLEKKWKNAMLKF